MNKAELFEAQRKQHAYDLMDRHMGEQRVIDEVTDKFEQRIVPLENRVNSLEHWRTFLGGCWMGVTAYLGFRK